MDNNELFRRLQKEMGVSNDALSRLLGVGLSTIEKRRSGAVKVSLETILAMKFVIGDSNGKK